MYCLQRTSYKDGAPRNFRSYEFELVLAGESCHDKALSPKQIHLLGTAYLSEERNEKAKKQVCLRQK